MHYICKSAMRKNLKAVLFGILFFIIVVLLLFFSLRKEKTTPLPAGTVGNTPGNANNRGLFCEYNGVVYFSNPYDGGALYSMSPNESNMKKLISSDVAYINAGGNYLFYYQEGASGASGLGYVRSANGLFRAGLNGKKIKSLSGDLIFNMQLINNHLYYLTSDSTGPSFYRLSVDGESSELLSNTGWNFAGAMTDGTVFYNGTESNHYLYRYDTATGSSSVVWQGNVWYPIYQDGYIYYLDVSDNYKLCRYSLNHDFVEVLTRDRVDCFNLAGGYLYYQKNSVTEPALKRMTLDGQNAEIVAEGNYTNINVTSSYVYFTPFGSEIPVYRTPVNGPVSVSTFSAAMEAALKYAED